MAGNLTGRLLSNRYLIGERIGIGGMAEVYQGQDNVLGRTVAIKVMLPQYAEDSTFTARFRQEAASAANLSSPYIVNVYDWGQDSDTSFIVMEFVRGSDLKTAIQQRGAINQRKVAEIGSQVCQALAVAHNLDIIHRDIKPQNIMVQPDGNVKVMDFGIARAKNSVKAKTSAVLGTAHYISPEQAQGKELTAASDIYSLGVVLYEAATGKLPFDGPDAVSVALKQVQEQPDPPRQINPAIDAGLEAIILKAMDKDPRNRFATARDMRRALNDFLAGRQINLGGFGAADTALITNNMPDIPPVAPYQTPQTSVMPASDGVVNRGDPAQQRMYTDQNMNTGKPEGKGKGRGVLIALGVIAAIGLIAALVFAVVLPGLSANATVQVPDVSEQSYENAVTELENAGFALGSVEYVYSDDVAADLVISQTPRGGTMQEKGAKINLSISQGVEQVAVPDLVDMTANEARSALQKAGLKYEAGAAEYSDEIKENHVVRQSPKAGEKVDKGETVTYYLSAGEETITIPDVLGDAEGEARSRLTNAGFEVEVDYAYDSETVEGHVIEQTPEADEKLKKGGTVSIIVSLGAQYYNVSAYVNNTDAGEISLSNTQVKDGDSVTFHVTTHSGYILVNVSDSNGNSYGASSSGTISSVHGDVSISAEFEEEPEPEPTPTPTPSRSAASSQASDEDEGEDEEADDTTDSTNTSNSNKQN